MKHSAHVAIASRFTVLFAISFTAGIAAADHSIADQVKAISDEYRQQHLRAMEALHSAKTREEGFKIYHEKEPSPARCVERLLILARSDPKGPGGFDALAAAVEFSDTSLNWKDEPVRIGDVIELLAGNHVENPRLGETFLWLKDFDTPAVRDFLRQAAKRNPSREVRGMAVFYLAMDLRDHANLIEIFRELPTFKANLEQNNGKDWVADIANADPKALGEEADALLVQAQNEFSDVKIDNQPIGDLAARMLFRLRRLQVGQIAPDIVGTDQEGQPMKLSNYRGKVVAIIFWGSWCGVCMQSVPAERALVKRMQGKPFVLLGVNSDPPGQVNAIIEKHQINWRSWSDGELTGPQLIAKAWDIRSWPQIYLIDGAGVIRYSELAHATSEDDLGRAVDSLVAQAMQ